MSKKKQKCFWCGVAKRKLSDDHIVPVAFGGLDEGNIVRACTTCNNERGKIVTAAIQLFDAATGNVSVRERGQRRLRDQWDNMKALREKWAAIESQRLGGRSVSDKLGSAEYPFPNRNTVGRSAKRTLRELGREAGTESTPKEFLESAAVEAARKIAEQAMPKREATEVV